MSTQNVPDDDWPAFPFQCQGPTTGPEIYYGLSMRDYFAGQALAGLASQTHDSFNERGAVNYGISIGQVAAESFHIADAMIAERNRRAASPSATPSGAGSPEPK